MGSLVGHIQEVLNAKDTQARNSEDKSAAPKSRGKRSWAGLPADRGPEWAEVRGGGPSLSFKGSRGKIRGLEVRVEAWRSRLQLEVLGEARRP